MSTLDPFYANAIQRFEGFVPKAGWDYKQYTNGYGTKALYPGEVIDRQTASQRFESEIGKAAQTVDAIAPNAPPGARAALISLTFNSGSKWANSGLGDLVKAGDWSGAAERLQQYNKAGGQVLPALAKRRGEEASWFNAPTLGLQTASNATPQAPPVIANAQPQQPASLVPQQQVNPYQVAQSQQPLLGTAQQSIPQLPAQQPDFTPPPLNAPISPQNLAKIALVRQAFSKIPTPAQFRGFSYG